MKQVLAAQLAEWIVDNARGYTKQDGNKIHIEGTIDAYDLFVYVQSLLADRSRSKSSGQQSVLHWPGCKCYG